MSSSVSSGNIPDQATRGFLHVPLAPGRATAARWTLWDALRRRWARSHPPASSDAMPAGGVAQQVDFRTWSECVRQLMGSTEDPDSWPALYAGGATPLEAARRAVLGRGDRVPMAGSLTVGEL